MLRFVKFERSSTIFKIVSIIYWFIFSLFFATIPLLWELIRSRIENLDHVMTSLWELGYVVGGTSEPYMECRRLPKSLPRPITQNLTVRKYSCVKHNKCIQTPYMVYRHIIEIYLVTFKERNTHVLRIKWHNWYHISFQQNSWESIKS